MEIYTTLEEAGEEIRRRWQDKALRQQVDEYLGGDIPESFCNKPRAVLFRNIIITDTEFQRFHELSKNAGLEPLGLEFLGDRFCTRNADKLRLGRIDIFEKMNRKNEPIIRCERIIDFKGNDNRRLTDVETIWGQKLVDLYHGLLQADDRRTEIFDMSDWIERNGRTAAKYYEKFFAFFICHGVLIENFIDTGEESGFLNEVVYPAFSSVCRVFGVTPLVSRLFTEEEITRCDQWYFPAEMKDKLHEIRYNTKGNGQ
jgi:hypothetical protein